MLKILLYVYICIYIRQLHIETLIYGTKCEYCKFETAKVRGI